MQSARGCWVRTDPFGPPDSQKSRWMQVSHVSSGRHSPTSKSTNIPHSGRHLLLAYRDWSLLMHHLPSNLLQKELASRPFHPERGGLDAYACVSRSPACGSCSCSSSSPSWLRVADCMPENRVVMGWRRRFEEGGRERGRGCLQTEVRRDIIYC